MLPSFKRERKGLKFEPLFLSIKTRKRKISHWFQMVDVYGLFERERERGKRMIGVRGCAVCIGFSGRGKIGIKLAL